MFVFILRCLWGISLFSSIGSVANTINQRLEFLEKADTYEMEYRTRMEEKYGYFEVYGPTLKSQKTFKTKLKYRFGTREKSQSVSLKLDGLLDGTINKSSYTYSRIHSRWFQVSLGSELAFIHHLDNNQLDWNWTSKLSWQLNVNDQQFKLKSKFYIRLNEHPHLFKIKTTISYSHSITEAIGIRVSSELSLNLATHNNEHLLFLELKLRL